MNLLMRATSVATTKSPPWRKGLGRLAGLALAALLAGCGQKGPLALPTSSGAASAPAAVR
ncbi:MAG: lipoprotein [Pseudomonadota bacterium]